MRTATIAFALLGLAACLPADHALPLGSVEFTIRATDTTEKGIFTSDGYRVTVDRALLSFKTMLIGRQDQSDACSYRGRAAVRNVVFDALAGNQQTFNGIQPAECPDVGLLLGPPDDATIVGDGVTSDDLVDLVNAPSAHARMEMTATKGDERYRVVLRFDTARTTARYGGCVGTRRGILIKPSVRLSVWLSVAVETFFQQGFGGGTRPFFAPFKAADDLGDGDGVVTMKELDQFPLTALPPLDPRYVTDVKTGRSFGDYMRDQFKSLFLFEGVGSCEGKEPGATE